MHVRRKVSRLQQCHPRCVQKPLKTWTVTTVDRISDKHPKGIESHEQHLARIGGDGRPKRRLETKEALQLDAAFPIAHNHPRPAAGGHRGHDVDHPVTDQIELPHRDIDTPGELLPKREQIERQVLLSSRTLGLPPCRKPFPQRAIPELEGVKHRTDLPTIRRAQRRRGTPFKLL